MPRLARRLTALLTLLSVLFASLGRAHVACASDAGGHASHEAGTAVAAPAEHHHDGAAHDAPCGTDAAAVGDCASVAHCATWVAVPDVVATLDAPATVGARVPFASLAPLGPETEPHFPPPKA